MSRGGVKKKTTIREIEGVPGTVEHGFRQQPITELLLPPNVREEYKRKVGRYPEDFGMRRYTMGPCNILIAREGPSKQLLWHLTISTPSRHPTWDEIKVARYRLLPLDICMGMLLPPPGDYVNVPEQDHVFQLWEITDPRHSWDVDDR
jgi:hypothetical protein